MVAESESSPIMLLLLLQQSSRTAHGGRNARRLHRHSLPLVLALLPSAGYGLFALLAYLQYPTAYDPIHHTLSELGSPLLNPAGSGFYRVGCVIGGVTTIAFFLSLVLWRRSGTTLQNRFLLGVQALGVTAGTAMVLFAVYADNVSRAHLVVLGILANSTLAFLLLSLIALYRPTRPQTTRVTVTLLASSTILVMYLIPNHHWAEWVPAFLAQAYIWVVGYETAKTRLERFSES